MNELKKKNIDKKFLEKLKKYKVTCKCGHVLVLIKEPLICNWCGRKVYKNKLEEFKDNLERKLR